MKIDYCWHTHTARCGHASGSDEEYVLSAIKAGIKVLGFSDHIFYPGVSQKGIRGDLSELENYISSINNLKEKYKDQIEIHLGFEVEYSPKFLNYYKELKEKYGIEYFICGQHFNFYDPENFTGYPDRHIYVKHLKDAIKSGLFTYIAHPDFFVRGYVDFNQDCINLSHTICKAAKKANAILEINVHGRTFNDKVKLMYAHEEFWKIVGEYDLPVIIGYDAHNPHEFDIEPTFFDEWIVKYHIRLIDGKNLLNNK